jgi:hypothetical protein
MKLSSSINRILSLSSHERKSSLESASSHNVEGQRYRVKVTRRSLPRSRSFHSPKPTPPIAGSPPEKVKQPRRKSAKENGVRVYLGSIGPAESHRPARRSSLKATSSYDNETRQLYEYVPDAAGGKAASTEAAAPIVPTFAQEQISRSRQRRRASMGAVGGVREVREETASTPSTAHQQRRRASMGGSCHEPLSSTTPNSVPNPPAAARPRRMSLGSRASKEAAHERAAAEKQQQEQQQLKQQHDDEATAILLAKMRELDAQLASGSQHKPRTGDFAYL